MENDIEPQEDSRNNPIEESDLFENTPEFSPEEDSTVQQDAVRKILEKNKHLYARAKKAEEELKKLKEAPVISPQKNDEESANTTKRLQSWQKKIELQIKGYSDEETEFIIRAGGNPQDPYIQAAIESMRNNKKVEQATPPPSSRPAPLQTSGKAITEMTPEERAQSFNYQAWKTRKMSGKSGV